MKPVWAKAVVNATTSSNISHMGVWDLEGWLHVKTHPLISWLLREKGSKVSQFQISSSFKEYMIFFLAFVYESTAFTQWALHSPGAWKKESLMTQDEEAALAMVEAPTAKLRGAPWCFNII